MGRPIGLEGTAEVVAGFHEVPTSWLGIGTRLILPNPSDLNEAFFTHDAELKRIRGTFGLTSMKLDTKTLKWESKDILTFIIGHRTDGKPKH